MPESIGVRIRRILAVAQANAGEILGAEWQLMASAAPSDFLEAQTLGVRGFRGRAALQSSRQVFDRVLAGLGRPRREFWRLARAHPSLSSTRMWAGEIRPRLSAQKRSIACPPALPCSSAGALIVLSDGRMRTRDSSRISMRTPGASSRSESSLCTSSSL